MIQTFHPYTYKELKTFINRLLDEGKDFSVKLIVDVNNQPHHWEIEY